MLLTGSSPIEEKESRRVNGISGDGEECDEPPEVMPAGVSGMVLPNAIGHGSWSVWTRAQKLSKF